MNKKYIKFHLIGATVGSAILVTTFTPFIHANFTSDHAINKTENSARANITTKNIGEAYVNKSGITWPNNLLPKYSTSSVY